VNFEEFLPEGLNPSKIQTRFRVGFISKILIQKLERVELDQKVRLFRLKLSITMPSLEFFEQKEGCVL
jgi:hypothetical protein